MKIKHIPCLIGLALLVKTVNAQSSASTFDVVSWNIEFFGAPYASGPANKDLQEENVKKICRFFDADIYGLAEVVDSMRLRRLVDSLGSDFDFRIAEYCSDGVIGSNGWRQGQKQAFIFKKSIFSNISTRGMMRSSATAVSNWANGRVPYLLNADVSINSVTKNINFIMLHAKSGSTASDYTRRLAGAQELKDTLDAHYASTLNFIIGDFNDALHTTIYTGASVSSYSPIVADSTDSDHYKSISLPLGVAGQTSMINFPNVIDNHIISNEVVPFYITGSAQIRTDVTTVVPDYATAHNTSDHYPVFSRYNLSGVVTSVPSVEPSVAGISVFPNPFPGSMNIKTSKTLTHVQMNLLNQQGQLVHSSNYDILSAGTITQILIPSLASGVYFLNVSSRQYNTTLKLLKQQ